MEQIKTQIIELLIKCAENAYSIDTKEKIEVIYPTNFSFIASEITGLMQIIFDPENQPNQFGIENPFIDKKCDFKKAVEPAIRYLLQNHNPHTKIYIDYERAELLKGEKCHNLNSEVPD